MTPALYQRQTRCGSDWLLGSPGPPLSVGPVPGSSTIADVVTVDGDELLAALGCLLLLPELVVLPAAFILPQLPVPALGPAKTQKGQVKQTQECLVGSEGCRRRSYLSSS